MWVGIFFECLPIADHLKQVVVSGFDEAIGWCLDPWVYAWCVTVQAVEDGFQITEGLDLWAVIIKDAIVVWYQPNNDWKQTFNAKKDMVELQKADSRFLLQGKSLKKIDKLS